ASVLSERLRESFATLKDPRVERTRLHLLSDVVTIAILSVVAGGEGWEDMELYGISKQAWLSTFLALPHGIPSADTFRRVFERLNPKEFEECFEQWVQQLVSELGVRLIAIDGKSARGSYDREGGTSALHLVSAWASEHRLVLAQAKVQDKSNEITAIPALLELLDLSGCIVTLDAMGTQKSIARQIYTAGADYILSLKSNHPTLFQQVNGWFQATQADNALPTPLSCVTETGHHRIDTRTVWTIPVQQLTALHQADEWAGLQTIVVVERTRRLWNKTTHEVQFYLTSLPHQNPQIASAIRQHWGIENGLHWVLDVTFNEDASRVRSLHAPHNLSLLRRFALNALYQAPGKRSLKQKSKRAAMDDTFMLQVLAAALPDSGKDSTPSCQ
ncbi:ISAs1 family transposase, partial [Alkalinema pantanalense CENA528]|uniref:ISAs1 family transposase n=1 Tax=Alkalinema pantanalense TaxID=1620705 RepID=UPI003D6F00CE